MYIKKGEKTLHIDKYLCFELEAVHQDFFNLQYLLLKLFNKYYTNKNTLLIYISSTFFPAGTNYSKDIPELGIRDTCSDILTLF